MIVEFKDKNTNLNTFLLISAFWVGRSMDFILQITGGHDSH